jgi:type III secretory pathway lipoprotein EscJ
MQRFYRLTFHIILIFLVGCKVDLVQNVEPKEAARMVSILSEAGVEVFQKLQANGNWSLSVKQEALLPAMTILDQYRLTPLKKEVAKDEKSLFPTPDEERRYSEKKRAQSIEETLRSLPLVLDARVLLTPPTSASIVVFAKPNFSVTENELKDIVSGASGITTGGIHVLLRKDPIEKIAISNSTSNVVNSWYSYAQKALLMLLGCILIYIGVKTLKNHGNARRYT